jgi:hypothetical protein
MYSSAEAAIAALKNTTGSHHPRITRNPDDDLSEVICLAFAVT